VKTPTGKLLGEMSKQLIVVGIDVPHDRLVAVKNSGVIPRALRATDEQLTAMRRAHGGKSEPRPSKAGIVAPDTSLVVPDQQLVIATAIEFKPDMFPGCKVGAAVQMLLNFGTPIEETLKKRDDPTRIGAVTSDLFTEVNYPTTHPGIVRANLFAVNHGRFMKNEELAAWPAKVKEATGRDLRYGFAKVEAQALQAAPRPAFDGCYPLVAYGNFWTHADDNRYFLRAYLYGAVCYVDHVWHNPQYGWFGNWWFLVLEYLLDLAI